MGATVYPYDVFISHAVEDKIPIANDLYRKLGEAGLSIWYSGADLNAGDFLSETIDDAMLKSRYGIVIFSQSYISKNWTLREYYFMRAREANGDKVILPVLYNITPEELVLKDIGMGNTFGVKAEKGIDHVTEKLLKTIRATSKRSPSRGFKLTISVRLIMFSLTAICLAYFGYITLNHQAPTVAIVNAAVNKQTATFQAQIENYISQLKSSGGKLCSPEEIGTIYTTYQNQKAYYRNEYEFFNGYTSLRFKKYVEPALGLDLESLTPFNSYQLTSPQIYLTERNTSGGIKEATYALVNTQPVHYTIKHSYPVDDNTYVVIVAYENNIRYVGVNLAFATNNERMKKHRMTLLGFLPEEKYTFEEEREGKWKLKDIE